MINIHDGNVAYWVERVISILQQFVVIWAAVHAGNRTALKPMIEVAEEKEKGGK